MKNLIKSNWLVLPVLMLFSLVIGTLGYYQYSLLHNEPIDWPTYLYKSLQLFGLRFSTMARPYPLLLEVARFLAPSITASAFFMAIWKPINLEFQLFRIRYFRKEHVVVCGLSKKAELLIKDFLKANYKVVVIELNQEHGSISNLREKGVIILHGNATDDDMLNEANILKAKFLLALTDTEETNILIAKTATEIFNKYYDKILDDNVLQLILHIDDYYTMQVFKEFHEKAIPTDEKIRKGLSKIDFHAFSIRQLAAAFIVDNYSPDQYIRLRNESNPPAHILILGGGIATQYLIIEVAQMFHFANLKATKITVVADDISTLSDIIKTRYPFLEKAVNIAFEETRNFFKNPSPILCDYISLCYVALDDDGESIHYSRQLRQHLFINRSQENTIKTLGEDKSFRQATPPIKVMLPSNTAIRDIFEQIEKEMEMLNISLIDINEKVCNVEMIVDNQNHEDNIAKYIWHTFANKPYREDKNAIDKAWKELKDTEKDSNRLPARHLKIKMRYAGIEFVDKNKNIDTFDFESIDNNTKDIIKHMEHNRWNAEKLINGFINMKEFTNEKEEKKFLKDKLKCHWYIVPYDQLSEEIQEYDLATFMMAPEIAKLNEKMIIKMQQPAFLGK